MNRGRIGIAVLLLLVIATSVLAGGSSGAAVNTEIIAGPGSFITTFYTPAVVITKGGTATFLNLDSAPHNVFSVPAGKFSSNTIGIGKSTPVKGVSALKRGTYKFKCTIHPNMTGTLTVS